MLGKTHLGAGILSSLVLCSNETDAMFLVIGSILSDIDHPNSMIGKNVPILPKILLHRGFTHSVLFFLALTFLNKWLGIGVLIHIFLDMMTRNGVRLFYPKKNFVRLPLAKNVKTGGTFEKVLFITIYILIITVLSFKIFNKYAK